jgi:hypothetical protein
MTRKDYEAIAAAIRAQVRPSKPDPKGYVSEHNNAVENTALAISRHMEGDNPRFDRARFLKDCGVQS